VNNTLSFDNYLNLATNPRGSVLFVPPLTALGNSLLFAIITTLVALIVGTVAAYAAAAKGRWSRFSEPIWALPLGASAVTLDLDF